MIYQGQPKTWERVGKHPSIIKMHKMKRRPKIVIAGIVAAVISIISFFIPVQVYAQNPVNIIHEQPGDFDYVNPGGIHLWIRLYRPLYNCDHGFSLCIGTKRRPKPSPVVLMSDTLARTPEAILYISNDRTKMKIVFLEDYDRSEGTTLEIDEGYNVFNIDDELKAALNINGLSVETGAYPIDFHNDVYGSVIFAVHIN